VATQGPPPPPREAPPAAPQTPPAAPPDDEARPATLAEMRTLRNWLIVAGVWAVAASAIAIIALLENTNDEPTGPRGVTASQLNRVQQDLDQRIDRLESQIEDLPQAKDVSRLDRRLKRVENGASDTSDRIKTLNGDLDDLQQRVDDLEQQQEQGSTTDQGTETGPSP
jgi:septal ring factor EnvC (AmiA/AmiB activator)